MQNVTKQTGGKIPSFPVNHISHPEWEKLAILACAGMSDPAAEIQAMRDAAASACEFLQGIEEHLDNNQGMFVQAAVAELRSLL